MQKSGSVIGIGSGVVNTVVILHRSQETEYADGLEKELQKLVRHKKLLYTTPVATAEDAAKTAGIDLTDKNFWRSALQTVADDIDRFCELVAPPNK